MTPNSDSRVIDAAVVTAALHTPSDGLPPAVQAFLGELRQLEGYDPAGLVVVGIQVAGWQGQDFGSADTLEGPASVTGSPAAA